MGAALVIISICLGGVGFFLDMALFPRADSLFLTFILFALPSVYVLGEIFWEQKNRNK